MYGRFIFAIPKRSGIAAVSGQAARRFRTERDGSIALIAAFLLPVCVLVAGVGLDYATYLGERSKIQYAADAAALAGAKELSLSDANRQNVEGVVDSMVSANLTAAGGTGSSTQLTVVTRLINNSGTPMQVEVNVAGVVKSHFGGRLGLGDTSINVKSVAIVVGKPNICLLALDPSSMGAIQLDKNAKIVGQNCAVYSNSTHSNGIKAQNSAVLTASAICSAGGKNGNQGNFQPDPLTDCPQFEDPLASRPEPVAGACKSNSLVITNQTIELDPGTYCGGLTVKGTSRVTFRPGVHVVKDGPLIVTDTASVEGVNVGFYFSGQAALFRFATGSTVNLTAPKDGEMAGLLFFGARTQQNVQHEILSDNARQLLGTIYLPTGHLSIDANQPIADLSAYTAIVAKTVRANSGPTVTLNSNFSHTDVHVPDGIRGAGQPVALSK